jgi:hypothetical protein
MLRRFAEILRRSSRWVLPLALVAAAPKCILCLAAWAGIAAALTGSPEICGGFPGSERSWMPWFFGLVAAVQGVRLIRSRTKAARPGVNRPAPQSNL